MKKNAIPTLLCMLFLTACSGGGSDKPDTLGDSSSGGGNQPSQGGGNIDDQVDGGGGNTTDSGGNTDSGSSNYHIDSSDYQTAYSWDQIPMTQAQAEKYKFTGMSDGITNDVQDDILTIANGNEHMQAALEQYIHAFTKTILAIDSGKDHIDLMNEMRRAHSCTTYIYAVEYEEIFSGHSAKTRVAFLNSQERFDAYAVLTFEGESGAQGRIEDRWKDCLHLQSIGQIHNN